MIIVIISFLPVLYDSFQTNFITTIFLLPLRNEKYTSFLWLLMDIVKIKHWFSMMFYCLGIMWIIPVVYIRCGSLSMLIHYRMRWIQMRLKANNKCLVQDCLSFSQSSVLLAVWNKVAQNTPGIHHMKKNLKYTE